jgi:hypothetical protein
MEILMVSKYDLAKTARMATFGLGCAFVGSLFNGAASAQIQGNMIHARQSLREAISYLQQATPDKGGHRENAINLAQQAIVEVNRGIRYANTH